MSARGKPLAFLAVGHEVFEDVAVEATLVGPIGRALSRVLADGGLLRGRIRAARRLGDPMSLWLVGVAWRARRALRGEDEPCR